MGSVGFKAFFKLAMVPVLVSAVLAFGLLFVWVVRDNFHSWVGKPNEQGVEYCTKEWVGNMVTYCIVEESSADGPVFTSRLLIGTTPMLTSAKVTKESTTDSVIILNFWDTFSNIIWGAGNASIASAWGATAGLIGGVEDIFAHIILTMLALVFMFMWVSVAAKYDDVTKAAFAPFEKLWNSVGNFVAHSPSYLPLPHPAFAALTNPAALENIARSINTSVTNRDAQIGKSMSDMMWGQRQSYEKAYNDFKSSVGTLDNVINKYLQTTERDPKEAKNLVLAAIEKLLPDEKNTPEMKAFKVSVENSRNWSDMAGILWDHPAAVEAAGLGTLRDGLWAQAKAAEQPFHNATFENDGTIKMWSNRNAVAKDNTGKYTFNLDPSEKAHVKTVLKSIPNIPVEPAKIDALFSQVFPQLSIPNTFDFKKKKLLLEELKADIIK
jgi:hypothetical protein